jgi:hypothetical protein
MREADILQALAQHAGAMAGLGGKAVRQLKATIGLCYALAVLHMDSKHRTCRLHSCWRWRVLGNTPGIT